MTRQIPPQFHRRGLVEEFVLEGKLIFRLFLDRRVSLLLKLIPVIGLLFVINPVDFPGLLDDLLVLIFSLILFVELCPRTVVDEHRRELRNVIDAEWHEAPKNKVVIDGEIRDADQQDSASSRNKK